MQWAFIALSVVLVAVVAAQAVLLRRADAALESARAADAEARLELQASEIRFARERSAREALSMEVGRLSGQPAAAPVPTLTLTVPRARAAVPPEPTVAPPSPSQILALTLVLPRGADASRRFDVAIRNWSTGEVLWSRHGVASSAADGQPVVSVHMAGDVLARGSYEIVLTAQAAGGVAEPVASYEVTVG